MKIKKIIYSLLLVLCVITFVSCNEVDNPVEPPVNPPVESVKTYTISFHSLGGTQVNSVKTDTNGKVSSPTSPTKEGYEFVGWYTDTTYAEKVNFSQKQFSSDTILYAKWERIKLTVSFESNGGTEIDAVTVEYGTRLEVSNKPSKVGYSFAGWYTDKELTNIFNFSNVVKSNLKLYAKWETKKLNVSFDSNGGSNINSVEVAYNTTIDEPTNPTKSGFIFAGWYSDVSLSTMFDFNTKIKSSVTLYAKWEKDGNSLSGNNVVVGEEYYGVVAGLLDDDLKAALHTLIETTHTRKLSYSEVWGALKVADKGEGNNVVCIYSGVLHAFSKQDSGSSGDDIWNREHVWPNSKGFGNKSHVAYSDIHHLYASNKNINSTRSNKDFGDFELLGITSYRSDNYGNKWNSTYFEPRDEVKGDLARAILYMVVRYDGDVCGSCNLDLELVIGSSASSSNSYDKIGRLGDLASLIKWHYEDPVSDAERARNEVVCSYQGNRNPFIDHPEFVYGLYSEYAKQYVS